MKLINIHGIEVFISAWVSHGMPLCVKMSDAIIFSFLSARYDGSLMLMQKLLIMNKKIAEYGEVHGHEKVIQFYIGSDRHLETPSSVIGRIGTGRQL